jgi:hydroxymethylbilane synthase
MGTRGSLLARAQSNQIADALERAHRGLKVEVVIYKTTGDRVTDRPLHEFGGKGLFTKEIEEDLLAGKVDFIVHSYKDVPVTMPLVDQSNLTVGAVPPREDPRDVLVSKIAKSIAELPKKACVGTGSLRRRCQLLALRPDLKVELLRGNVDTRARKGLDGTYDAVVLAMAGLRRSALFDSECMFPIPLLEMLPAAAQGALLLQCREDDAATRALLSVMNDPRTEQCVALERAIVEALNGDCHSPIAVYGECFGNDYLLQAAVGRRGGKPPLINAVARGSCVEVVNEVVSTLMQRGAVEALGTVQTA